MTRVFKLLTLPPVLMTGGIVASWGTAQTMPLVTHPVLTALSAVLVVSALALVGVTLTCFARAKTPVMPDRTAKTLMTTGPFAYSRNPIYLGFAALLLGIILFLGAPINLAIFAIFVALVQNLHIIPEEQMLCQAFSKQATAYFAQTRRWI